MFHIIDYQAKQPVSMVGQVTPGNTIPHSPNKLDLAMIQITIPHKDAHNNHVELIATVGVRGVTETSQLLFRIFRDGKEIFNAQEGVEADPTSELNYIVTFQAIDKNVGRGPHNYLVTVENLTNSLPRANAAVVGPISFSGLAIASPHRHHHRDRDC